ncbi:uncharacterized protein LOC144336325 [Macaca mulatta]
MRPTARETTPSECVTQFPREEGTPNHTGHTGTAGIGSKRTWKPKLVGKSTSKREDVRTRSWRVAFDPEAGFIKKARRATEGFDGGALHSIQQNLFWTIFHPTKTSYSSGSQESRCKFWPVRFKCKWMELPEMFLERTGRWQIIRQQLLLMLRPPQQMEAPGPPRLANPPGTDHALEKRREAAERPSKPAA